MKGRVGKACHLIICFIVHTTSTAEGLLDPIRDNNINTAAAFLLFSTIAGAMIDGHGGGGGGSAASASRRCVLRRSASFFIIVLVEGAVEVVACLLRPLKLRLLAGLKLLPHDCRDIKDAPLVLFVLAAAGLQEG